MKITKKIVNGTIYLYALDNIYINKGRTIQKNKSLGAAATTTNVATKKRDFQTCIIGEEARLRTEYWHNKASQEFLAYTDIAKIERLRANLFHLKKTWGN